MNSRLNGIAILSEHSGRIGLFEYHVVTQLNNLNVYERIHWIHKKYTPIIQFVGARALLRNDNDNDSTLNTQHIRCVSQDNFHLDSVGRMYPNQIYTADLLRLPLRVSFWENFGDFPVYKLTPDIYLPWDTTIVDILQWPYIVPRRQRAFLSLPADATCAITFEDLTLETAFFTPCGHAFSIAIAQALENDPRCPLCRTACTFEDCIRPTNI
jgi:hypothetical protein